MKKVWIVTVIFLTFAFAMGVNAQYPDPQTYKLSKVLEWITRYYVDSVNEERLVENAIYELLKELDPHSSYLTREEVIEMNEPLQGNFEGIGVTFNILNDTVYIVSPVSGGPSDKVGVMAGDRILSVDGRNIAGVGITTDEVFSLLRGSRGSEVIISVKRKNRITPIDFTIIRDKIPIYSLDASYKVTDDIGYIKLNRFALTTMDEFRDALESLRKEGVNDLILDLTGNGGGYLEVAIELADEFLETNKVIVYTEGLKSPRREYKATRDGEFEKGNLVVLIDEGSASASEIFTGAIQDWDRGIIVGRRSFGKGLVQKPLLLPDQSMIRLTIARYYTPTGRLIQKPYDMGNDAYNQDLINRFNNGEFIYSDSIHFPDSLKYFTLKNTRIVYGGGGIMPDYFVSIDTSHYTDYYTRLAGNGTIVRFALEYVDRNRDQILQNYKSFGDFNQNFRITEDIRSELVALAIKDGIPDNPAEYEVSKLHIERALKAYIARDMWTNNEFYEVINSGDDKFRTAVMILENWDKYEASLLNEK